MADIKSDPATGSSADRKGELGVASCQAPFSIATPAVTQFKENLNDALFLHQPHSYQSETTIENHHTAVHPNDSKPVIGCTDTLIIPNEPRGFGPQDKQSSVVKSSSQNCESMSAAAQDNDVESNTTNIVPSKKKNKANKKSLKLDTKSKLEKSRQSARECRARKKLRYQYLEDLVCNREKAVVKLREELTIFCQMSEKLDSGTISETDRHFLIEQAKENNESS